MYRLFGWGTYFWHGRFIPPEWVFCIQSRTKIRSQDADQVSLLSEIQSGKYLQKDLNWTSASCLFCCSRNSLLPRPTILPWSRFYIYLLPCLVPTSRWDGRAAGDSQTSLVSLIGGTAGRTTLNGEVCSTKMVSHILKRRLSPIVYLRSYCMVMRLRLLTRRYASYCLEEQENVFPTTSRNEWQTTCNRHARRFSEGIVKGLIY